MTVLTIGSHHLLIVCYDPGLNRRLSRSIDHQMVATDSALVKQTAYTKFDGTVELHLRMGVDVKQADQLVRGVILLPHGTGKKVRVLVFAKGEKEKEARDAGADHVGAEDLADKIQKGWTEFDTVVATYSGRTEFFNWGPVKSLSDQGRQSRSNRSGRSEIYVRPFRRTGTEQQISVNGGAQVRWNRDGKELFYIAADGNLMAAPIQITNQTAKVGLPAALFQAPILGADQVAQQQQYAVARDGRFLISTGSAVSPIIIVTNWAAALKK